MLDPGDELVYADPAYPAYASAASYLEAKPIPVHLLESRNWRLDLDELAAKVGPKTKAVVINSPHNPTGGVLLREDLERIAELAHRHDFLVISDEIYSRNRYVPHFHSISQIDGMRDRTIIVDGFSKAYAMTGWRLGYCIAPEAIAKMVTLFNNNTFSCVATFVQRAGIAALTGDDGPVQRMNEIFRERRDAIVAGLNAIPGVSCTVARRRVLRLPQRLAHHRRRQPPGAVAARERRRGVPGRLVVRRRPARAICASPTRPRSTTSRWALDQLREHLPNYPR